MQEAFLLLESRLTFVSLNITGTAAASICFAEYHRNCSSINSMSGPAMCVPRSGKLVWLTLIELASAGRCLKQVHKSIAAFMCSANASCSVHVGKAFTWVMRSVFLQGTRTAASWTASQKQQWTCNKITGWIAFLFLKSTLPVWYGGIWLAGSAAAATTCHSLP